MEPVNPPAIRYIKMGSGGVWNAIGFERGIIPLGFVDAPHDLCADGRWDDAASCLTEKGRSRTAIKQDIRELRDFYELPEGTLWITFADGHLCWALAGNKVEAGDGEGPARYRPTLSGWRRVDVTGRALSVSDLSSALTKTAGYRRTICGVDAENYLLRKINAEPDPLVTQIKGLEKTLTSAAQQMIAGLHWRDFELLIDLLFARGGWQRISAAGDGEVDIDLLLEQPMTAERAWVQIKSSADQASLDDYLGRFERDGSAGHFFFVCHSPISTLSINASCNNLHLLTGSALARKTIEAGLLGWLQKRAG